MYLPKHFEEKDRTRVTSLIRDYPLATLMSISDGAPVINHFPMILDPDRDDRMILIGHMAVKNPHTSLLPDGGQVTAVFHGPNAYITPKWYAEHDVPTWNYAVVHASGRMRWVKEFKPLIAILEKLTSVFESGGPDPWRFVLPDDLKSEVDLTSAIIGFEIEVESVDAKFKLSQNRSEMDRRGVIQGLASRDNEMSRKVREAMGSI